MEKNNKGSLLTVLMNLAVSKALKAKQVHLLTVFTSLCFYSGLKLKMGGNVSTSELIAPTMRSSFIVLLTCSTQRMTWMRPGNIACFLPLPPHPSAEKDNFSPASPTLAFVVGRSSPGAGRRVGWCHTPAGRARGLRLLPVRQGWEDTLCLTRMPRRLLLALVVTP